MAKSLHEPLFHLSKRTDIRKRNAWLIRIAAFVLSIFACAIISVLISHKSMGFFFSEFFRGNFGASRNVWNLFHETAILLIIALAVTPCFKMRFWNIGGEGQVLMGALGCSVIVNFMAGTSSDAGTIITSLIMSIVFGIMWAVIPAVFKAKWNTNETLLTLMMNYIAVCLVEFFIKSVATSGTGTLSFNQGIVGPIGGNEFILKIVVVFVVTVLMTVYLKYSKHGYELTVVGESPNTARYIGINTPKVIIRTLVLCGAICGITGFLLVSATNNGLSAVSTVGGRGFTGVLISWLAHFNPIAMALCSFLVVFVSRGASQFSDIARLGASYPDVMTGIFFFFIIATEFFINFKIVFRSDLHKNKSVKETVSDTSVSDGGAVDEIAVGEGAVDECQAASSEGVLLDETATIDVEDTKNETAEQAAKEDTL